jgi:hypothetical protein
MLMRFLQRLVGQLVDALMQAFHMPYVRGPPNRDEVERDAFLKEKFDRMNEHFLRRLNVMRPEMDNSNKIKVIAVMPTPSLQTCLDGPHQNDAVVVFCVVNWTLWDKQAFMSEQNDQWMTRSKMRFFFTFAHDMAHDDTTYFMAIWTAPHTRRDWMQSGLNTTRDNVLPMVPVMESFWDARNKALEKELESRGSQ